jgi:uncharacterized phage infection (PIP) family protein YhgE
MIAMNPQYTQSKEEAEQALGEEDGTQQRAEGAGNRTSTSGNGHFPHSGPEEISQYSEQVWQTEASIRQEVEEIADAFKEGAESELSLTEKVENLRTSLESITEEVQSWRGKNYYLDAIDNVKQQVDEVHAEWDSLSATLTAQRERIESLLQAFPGVIETSTRRALTLRVSHLEELVHDLIQERESKSNSDKARKQLVVSVVALALTVVFWGAFLGMSLFGSAS